MGLLSVEKAVVDCLDADCLRVRAVRSFLIHMSEKAIPQVVSASEAEAAEADRLLSVENAEAESAEAARLLSVEKAEAEAAEAARLLSVEKAEAADGDCLRVHAVSFLTHMSEKSRGSFVMPR